MAKRKKKAKQSHQAGDALPNFPNVDMLTIERDLNNEFEELRSGYNTEKARRIKFHKEYKFQPYGTEIQGESTFVDSSIFDVVEWLLPALIQPLVETNDFMRVSPVKATVRNIIKAQVAREVLNFNIRRRNNFYLYLYDVIKGFLIGGVSFGKLVWIEADEDAGIPVAYVKTIAIPADQIRYDWTVKNFEDSTVVTQEEDLTRSEVLSLFMKKDNIQTHEKTISEDDLFEGVIPERFNTVIEQSGATMKTDYLRDELAEARNYVGQANEQESDVNKSLYLRREQWTMYDMEGNGFMEPIMAVFINNDLVQVVRNIMPDKKPPFMRGECIRDSEGNPGMGQAEILSDVQKYQTGIMRMFSNNLNAQNNGLMEYDMTEVDQVAIMLLQQAPSGSRVPLPTRKIGSIQPIPVTPIAGQAFSINEKIEVLKENRSGFTRYSQGQDSNSLNQTATGITQILSRSDLRAWEMAMRFAESHMTDMARKTLAMAQKFMGRTDIELAFSTEEITVTSAEGKPVTIAAKRAKDWIIVENKDIGGFFDIQVDIQSKSEVQQQITSNLNWLTTMAPYIAQGVIKPEVVQVIALETAKLMGNKAIETQLRGDLPNVGNGAVTVSIPAAQDSGGSAGQPAPLPGQGPQDQGAGEAPRLPPGNPEGVSG